MAERLIIGMSGASGAPLAVELLRQLHVRCPQIETHLVISRGAEMTLQQETGLTAEALRPLVHTLHDNDEIGANVASGSFPTMGMIVVPCSMKTAAGICSGYSDNLLLRAADVCMKERRRLVLVARESPLSTIHLRNLYELSQMGAVIMPPMLTYYNHPSDLEDCTRYTANRILAQFGLNQDSYEWSGINEPARPGGGNS
ncbi:MAG: UbiX family flavin prenyltransferase [Oscillospiraceae bacterium]|nr:UbiX family flavin prenyltransferase [Oscillospiraceae bacterium]